MPRALFLVCLALPLSAAAPQARPGARIAAFLDASPVARTSFWGIRLVSLDHDRLLFERNADRLFLPASNAKLFTTALALVRLGPDYRFHTRVLADRTPGEDGSVESLRMVGGGGRDHAKGAAQPAAGRQRAGGPVWLPAVGVDQ